MVTRRSTNTTGFALAYSLVTKSGRALAMGTLLPRGLCELILVRVGFYRGRGHCSPEWEVLQIRLPPSVCAEGRFPES